MLTSAMQTKWYSKTELKFVLVWAGHQVSSDEVKIDLRELGELLNTVGYVWLVLIGYLHD